ncbi:ATP-binding protein [Candidatus Woesearchaeota archaeon]|nr:ATP-binding protein [Candidatus Woesearchaeota archaeon]
MDYQIDLFKSYLLDESVRMIVIKGLRRVGKTSLLHIGLQESKVNYIYIDVRDAPFYERKEFFVSLINKIKEKNNNIWTKTLEKIVGVSFSYNTFSLDLFLAKEENISSFFSGLNEELKKKKETFIFAFDEVQLLKQIKFDYFLASVFDNYHQLKLVITGSEIGLINIFLGKENYDAPLFGRANLEITIGKAKEETVSKFLEEGFTQIKKEIKFVEIRDVLENFDGIIGWATYYGWYRSKNFPHQKAIEKVKEEGKIIVRREWENFLASKKAKVDYLKIIRFLARGKNNWALLKQNFSKERKKISDSQLSFCLTELIAYGFVEKLNEQYFLVDPMLSMV